MPLLTLADHSGDLVDGKRDFSTGQFLHSPHGVLDASMRYAAILYRGMRLNFIEGRFTHCVEPPCGDSVEFDVSDFAIDYETARIPASVRPGRAYISRCGRTLRHKPKVVNHQACDGRPDHIDNGNPGHDFVLRAELTGRDRVREVLERHEIGERPDEDGRN